MNALSPLRTAPASARVNHTQQLVTFVVNDQMFGLSALKVRDVLREQPLTRVPLAKPEIAGAMNLRGHIVTAIDVRARLGVQKAAVGATKMCVVVEKGAEAFCLVVDAVGDVVSVDPSDIEPKPASLAEAWAQISTGLVRIEDKLLLMLDVDELLNC